MPLRFDWQRFWFPRGTNCVLNDDGFLLDPTERAAMLFRTDAMPFSKIDPTPCLGLLGEPGSGKSEAMKDVMSASGAVAERQRLVFDLKSYGSEERLVRDVFDNPSFQAWATGDQTLEVFIDSLDECLLRVTTVADIFAAEFAKHSERLSDLRFRVACRTAEWPTGFEEELKHLFGQEAVGVYEIAPLTRSNVVVAAKGYEVDPESFLEEVRRVKGMPLAVTHPSSCEVT